MIISTVRSDCVNKIEKKKKSLVIILFLNSGTLEVAKETCTHVEFRLEPVPSLGMGLQQLLREGEEGRVLRYHARVELHIYIRGTNKLSVFPHTIDSR